MTKPYLGDINGHIVGRVLKEAVRRAMVIIRAERLAFEATQKQGYGGDMDDVFTSADRKAQDTYLRTFKECFPLCGVIAEEDHLQIDPSGDCRSYFTVDPLDGTKAYIRRQSHGVGTMIALVHDGEVISAYIGDINTREIFGFRPGSDHVYRITELDTSEELTYQSPYGPENNYVLLRDPPEYYAPKTQETIRAGFKRHQIDGGSIGTWAARLWKREVAALIIPGGGHATPWDVTPVLGISKKLGYDFYRMGVRTWWEKVDPVYPTAVEKNEGDLLIVHREDASRLLVEKGLIREPA